MKPILFNTEMVQALLDGRKTVTRRLVKFLGGRNPTWTGYIKDGLNLYNGTNEVCNEKAKYQVGDILYVKETWQLLPSGFDEIPPEMNYIYKATDDLSTECTKWRESSIMSKEAARIFLRVKDIRVEKIKDITNEEAVKEGFKGDRRYHPGVDEHGCTDCMNKGWNEPPTVEFFETIYDIYPDATENSYVWVIEFEKISKEETE